MKRILSLLITALLFLSACSLTSPSTPSAEVVQTSVALTLTAYPSRTPVPSSPTPILKTPTMQPSDQATSTVTTAMLLPSPTTSGSAPIIYPTPIPAWNPAYADQFIRYYYQHINARDYVTTWSLLTDAFKLAVNPASAGGYSGYCDYWNTVGRVDIQYVTVTSVVGVSADVVVDMVYFYGSGSGIPSHQPFRLYYNSSRGTWMFDAGGVAVPTSVTYPSSSDSFIYFYFNNINARNYGLTWSLLSPSFIAANNSPAQGGYSGYVDYWNTIARVDITYVTITSLGSGFADVTVGMVYNKVGGAVSTSNQPFHLIYNSSIPSWQFYSPATWR